MGALKPDKLRVLVLDEDVELATVIKSQISALGYPTEHETCPAKSIRYILDQKFDLLLSEYHMKGLDGFQVAQILRTMGSMAPVILHTAVTADFCADDLAHVGILGVIPKSLGNREFIRVFLNLASLGAN
jgi:two-component system capsular synthesis sensor histidine kinase RcsC